MTHIDLEEISKSISEPRLAKYSKETTLTSDLLDYYVLVIKQNQRLYPAFHILEVILRNKIHLAICEIYGIQDWLLGYAQNKDALTKIFKSVRKETKDDFDKQIKSVFEAEKRKINEQKRLITEGDLIAGLTFGFWTTLLGRPFSVVLADKGLYKKVFLNFQFSKLGTKEFTKEESEIRYKINEIRKERNRVFHHEIAHDFKTTEELIWEMIRLMCSSSYSYFNNIFR